MGIDLDSLCALMDFPSQSHSPLSFTYLFYSILFYLFISIFFSFFSFFFFLATSLD